MGVGNTFPSKTPDLTDFSVRFDVYLCYVRIAWMVWLQFFLIKLKIECFIIII